MDQKPETSEPAESANECALLAEAALADWDRPEEDAAWACLQTERGEPTMFGNDTHYASGDEIRVGDHVTVGDWSGAVVFVVGTQSYAPGYNAAGWDYLGRGFMIDYDKAGLVFSHAAGEEVLVRRA